MTTAEPQKEPLGQRPEPTSPPPPSGPGETLRATPLLRRSRTDRVIAGVCGGLGHYLNVDPVIVRIAFVALAFTGAGVLAYIIAWLLIPEEREGEVVYAGERPDRTTARIIIGGALIVIGALVLAERVWPWFDGGVMWALALIIIGAAVILAGARR